jgi:penicillin-binding protein 2
MGQTFIRKIYLGGFFLLCLSLFYCQIFKGDYYLERAKNNYVRVIPLHSIRGTIFDRNHVSLAYDKASFNIAVIPYQIRKTKKYLFNELSAVLNYDINLIYKNYNKNLANVFSPIDIILDINKKDALRLKEIFGDDILINPQPTRYYPYPFEFAHVLGYVKEAMSFYKDLKKYGYTPIERAGFLGIEQYYDSYLKGENGGSLIEVDAKGKVVGFLGEMSSEKGKDIQLTIDQKIQKAAFNALENKRGVILLLDSNSGEILSLVSSPSFDSNCFIRGENIENLLRDKNKPLINRIIQATYPLGSTFKPIVAIAALEAKKITPYTTFTCQGNWSIGGRSFKCAHVHNVENLYHALQHSCNIYFYNVGKIVGVGPISNWAKKFGLDAITDIDLPYERKGLVPSPLWKSKKLKKAWFGGDTINLSIGQGFMSATPLENTLAINVFANGGYLVRPYLLKKIDDVDSGLSEKVYLDISRINMDAVKQGMIDVVRKEEGTAHLLKKLKLKVAGKTGTAQTKGKSHGWFIGFFPYNDPQYTVCAFLENCSSSFYSVKTVYNFLKRVKEEELL